MNILDRYETTKEELKRLKPRSQRCAVVQRRLTDLMLERLQQELGKRKRKKSR